MQWGTIKSVFRLWIIVTGHRSRKHLLQVNRSGDIRLDTVLVSFQERVSVRSLPIRFNSIGNMSDIVNSGFLFALSIVWYKDSQNNTDSIACFEMDDYWSMRYAKKKVDKNTGSIGSVDTFPDIRVLNAPEYTSKKV